MPLPRPRVRPLEAFPVQEGGETRYGLRDPEGLFDGTLVVPGSVLFLMGLLDGSRTAAQVAQAWRAATKESLTAEEVEGVVGELAEALAVEGPAVERARAEALAAWRALPARPPAHAGAAYPRTPAACARFLDAQWKAAEGVEVPARVEAVVAPHIDLRGGGACHGAAARAMAASPAEVFVVLGTSHGPLSRPFALTRHAFDTPAGRVEADRDLVDRLASRGGGGLLDDERAHRDEHSVEFQALWLAHLAKARGKPLRIVPVLVGSLHARIEDGRTPREDAAVADMADALREVRRDLGDRVAFVASVDLAHVGPKYGGKEKVDAAGLASVLEADRGLIGRAVARDPAGWMRLLHEEGDRRNVCGAAPAWLLLSVLEGDGPPGRLLRHDAWEIDPATGSHVSFCAIAYGR